MCTHTPLSEPSPSPQRYNVVMRLLSPALFCLFFALNVPAGVKPKKIKPIPPAVEELREATLQNRLCADKDLNCSYVRSLFDDPRFQLYTPPPPAPPQQSIGPKDHQRNPYLTVRFGLLTPESLERCRGFINQYGFAFDEAVRAYGVPKEVICGHLRIETNFGMTTPLSPHPMGAAAAFSRLVTLYVRQTTRKRQKFAVTELEALIAAAVTNGWDLFDVPGSSTGAIGLLQLEPNNFYVAVDGDDDGKIDLFDPPDAIMSLAHFLAVHGWDSNPEHQQKAIYSYYGKDPHKFYMKAVLAYAQAETSYLRAHPIEPVPPVVRAPLPRLPFQFEMSQPPPPPEI